MTSNSTTPRLEVGKPAPNFTLPAAAGGTIKRSAYRARKHLALLFLPVVDLPSREYLEALRDCYAEIREADGEVLVVVSDRGASAEGLQAALDVPFPLLLDPDGAATSKFLPDGAAYGVFILDRYATLHAQWALTARPLPNIQELIDWLNVVDRQCVL
jgi:peroxiredoxin Q/BCP